MLAYSRIVSQITTKMSDKEDLIVESCRRAMIRGDIEYFSKTLASIDTVRFLFHHELLYAYNKSGCNNLDIFKHMYSTFKKHITKESCIPIQHIEGYITEFLMTFPPRVAIEYVVDDYILSGYREIDPESLPNIFRNFATALKVRYDNWNTYANNLFGRPYQNKLNLIDIFLRRLANFNDLDDIRQIIKRCATPSHVEKYKDETLPLYASLFDNCHCVLQLVMFNKKKPHAPRLSVELIRMLKRYLY